MNLLTSFLLAFAAVGPLSARGMPGPETTVDLCTLGTCGVKCVGKTVSVAPCLIDGHWGIQSCCGST
ncbi:hypothetical protein BDR03DRAFT_948168 [Suillus americanus]|nr:hypothetical protein BDR03DRAFT_948168 [Suillus americanus]